MLEGKSAGSSLGVKKMGGIRLDIEYLQKSTAELEDGILLLRNALEPVLKMAPKPGPEEKETKICSTQLGGIIHASAAHLQRLQQIVADIIADMEL